MKHVVTRELYTYWSHLRGSRAAPERRDIDPAAIRTLLSDTFILEVGPLDAEPSFTIRLSGVRLNALLLCELKGRSLLTLWNEEDRGRVVNLLQGVLDDCCPAVAGLRAAPADHRPIDLEMVLLPLKHHGRTHARVLGAIAPSEIPSWLGLLPVEPLTFSSHRLLREERRPERVAAAGPAALAEAEEPRRYGRFLVHQGGR